MHIDKTNSIILSALRENCRMSQRVIASRANINIITVANRIKKLEDNGVIKGYLANIDYSKVGFKNAAFVRIVLKNSENSNKKELENIINLPQIVFAISTTGTYNLTLLLCGKNFDEIIKNIGMIGQNENIETLKSELVVEQYKYFEDFNPMDPTFAQKTNNGKIRKKPLDELDLGILREIRVNAKASLKELSSILGAPISTIKERTDRLENSGIILGYIADLDFSKLGFWGSQFVGINLESNYLNDKTLIDKLVSIPQVGCLFRTLGNYDIYASVLVNSTDHAMELIEEISKIPGVAKCEPQIMLSKLKIRTEFNPLSDFKMKHEDKSS